MIKSKAQVSVEELGEQYCLIGPYNEACVRTEVELLEPHSYVYKEVIKEMRDAGMKVSLYSFINAILYKEGAGFYRNYSDMFFFFFFC